MAAGARGRGVSYVLETPDGPPAVQAAGLCVAVLRHTGHNSWDELGDELAAGDPATVGQLSTLRVTVGQNDLMNAHAGLLALVRVDPPVVPVVCADCGGWVVMGGGPKPASCRVNTSCGSKNQVKVPVRGAKKVPV